MERKVLKVQMLGGFAIYYGEEAVRITKLTNSKSLRLFQMLLLSIPSGISKRELMDNLYGWNDNSDVTNRNKNLNNLIYRLRGQMASCGLPDMEYVEIGGGIYSINKNIPLELDVQQFEEKIGQAKMAVDESERIRLFLASNEMYRGELLPGNLSDTWFYQKSNYYKKLYTESILELEKAFETNGDYRERIQLYARAAAIYPFDNWQTKQMRCNLEINQYEDALKIYNETVDLYARELGTPPARDMQKYFEQIELRGAEYHNDGEYSWKYMDRAFEGKKEDIKAAIFEDENVRGAYYCSYPSFVDYCRLVVRVKERNDFNAVLMFLTLSGREKKNGQERIDLPVQMELLKMVIGESLRIGDAYTRYGNRHFILMLIKVETELCSSIFQRIEKAYVSKSGKGRLWYFADMTQELKRKV